MKKLTFHKMHGCGNDYIYIDAIQKDPLPGDKSDIVRRLSDRHFGVGGDGVVFILPSKRADYRMRMFNQDGSEAEMCGNAIRCVGKYLYDFGYTQKTTLKIATKAGVKNLWLHTQNGKVSSVSVDMGTVSVEQETKSADSKISKSAKRSNASKNQKANQPKQRANQPLLADMGITRVNVGNPHEVKILFPQELDQLPDILIPWNKQANNEWACIEHSSSLTTNSSLPYDVRMRVWERGTGETLACGTGAVAVAATFIESGVTHKKINVHLRGGTLQVERLENGHYILTGEAKYIYKGEFVI